MNVNRNMSGFADCCVKGFNWDGTPEGRETKLANLDTYVTGSNQHTAILMVADLFGWKFNNLRLLADHYANEVDACVYLPDFFDGEILDENLIRTENFEALDLPSWASRNNKKTRRDNIFNCAKALRSNYHKVAATGYCFGGWAVFQLGAKSNISSKGIPLVDCISTAHPSWLEKTEIDEVGVPVQICAPEHDPVFTPELKEYANRVIPTLGLEYDYQYFPGVVHAFATRGNPDDEKELRAMKRAKDAAVHWFRLWLHD